MNDSSGLLAPDFGNKSQSKSAPMSSSKPSSYGPTRSPWNATLDDSDSLFSSSSYGRGEPSSSINFDSIFGGSSGAEYLGFGELRCVFDGSGSKQKQNDAYDDLLRGFGRKDLEPKRFENVEDVGSGFDDLLHGFGRISLPSFCPNLDTASIKLLKCEILPKNCHVAPSPLDTQTAPCDTWHRSFHPDGNSHSFHPDISYPHPVDIPPGYLTSEILLRRHSTWVSHIQNSSPPAFHPDISHSKFCPADVLPSPDISQPVPVAG
ncbi:hypothetical protein CK203_056663 [Vitis vinifera]|uniref:Uncharacterized protein n=1 Tax=Vitis vinifera TaxID=29760 RepID=A0A438CW24_VITVI|nr:hypothetical protein CK203_095435 [Vitis vinifera]RVW73834.1 hypothetical protein CK203_056663 [Vitis vinifera]